MKYTVQIVLLLFLCNVSCNQGEKHHNRNIPVGANQSVNDSIVDSLDQSTKEKSFLDIQEKAPVEERYDTVVIGDQVWMAKNLNTRVFQNGDSIPHVRSNDAWEEFGQKEKPAWCYFKNDASLSKKGYGKL